MEKAVVIGGSGFLGSYLVTELSNRGYSVVIGDILKPTELIKNTEFRQCNILNSAEVEKLFDADVKYVFNLAGFANLDSAIHNPYDTFNQNVMGNINVLEACKKHKINKLVYASSAYAMNNKGSFYGISKLASEKVIEEYHNRYNLNYTILRYGSVYSEKEFENNYIYKLVKEAVSTKNIEHKGNGEEIREYIHAIDAAKLSVDSLSDNFNQQIVMLTGVERIKRLELFKMIEEILGEKIKINLSLNESNHHYQLTPYVFEPTSSKKLVANPYVDMGQGILACIRSVYNDKK